MRLALVGLGEQLGDDVARLLALPDENGRFESSTPPG